MSSPGHPVSRKAPRSKYNKHRVIARRNKTLLAPENRETAARLDQGLEAGYRMIGYEVKRIGVMPVQDRLRARAGKRSRA